MRRLRWSGMAALAACALAALPAAAQANVQVGSSGWLWGNPLPQGNTLRAMAFAGTTGYAVGDFGTLLKTTDAGDTWTGLPAGTFSNLTEVQAVDANTVVAGGGCVARLSTDGGQSFSRIAFTPVESSCPDGSHLAALWYVNAQHGYLVLNDGSVFETTDGQQFATKTAIPGTKQAGGGVVPTDAVFTSDTGGFVTTSDGNIYVTTDSGVSWKSVSATNRPVQAITFASATVGYAVGDGSLFLKTSDGGATWVAKEIGSGQNLTAIRCADEKACVATTATGTQLVITVDGAATFSAPTPSTDPLFAAAFASPLRLAAAGQQGSTVVSDDAGANSRPIGGRLTGSFSRIVAGKVAGTAFAPGPNATLGKTVDGGKTWTRGNVTTTANVLDVSFPTANAGYALDAAGGLFVTTTGGGFWKTLDTGSTARPGAVYAPTPTTVMVIGPTGVRRSVDGGGSFDAVKGGAVARTSLQRVDRAGSAIVAYGAQDVIRSTDAGKTWKVIKKPGKYIKKGKKRVNRLGVRRVDFVDATHGFLLDTSGRLWRTSQRRVELDRAAGDWHERRARHVVLLGAEGLPRHQQLRRRAPADGLPAADRRRRRDLASAVRGVDADRRRRRRGGRGDRLPAGRSAVAALQHDRWRLGGQQRADDHRAEDALREGPAHHRDRQAQAGVGQRAGDGELPAPGVDALDDADRERQRQRVVHDELEPGQGRQPVRRAVAGQLPRPR